MNKRIRMVITAMDLTLVRIALNNAERHNLEPKVVATAIKYALQHPESNISECMDFGLKEWVK
jgi:hypothetical protein